LVRFGRQFQEMFVAIAMILAMAPAASQGQLNAPSGSSARDIVSLKDGRNLAGMILNQNDQSLRFIEIRQPPGKADFAVIQRFDRQAIEHIVAVPDSRRRELASLVDQIRNRTQIRASAVESIVLQRATPMGEKPCWKLHGDGFVLTSYLDEKLSREMAVRAEQIFLAYQHWLPKRVASGATIEVILFGDRSHYRSHLAKLGLPIENPALFIPRTNQIFVGSNLQAFADRYEVARQRNRWTGETWDRRAQSHQQMLQQLANQLKEQNWPAEKIAGELQVRRETWQREFREASMQLRAAERKNDAMLQSMIEGTSALLCHESLHAHLENHLFPQASYHVPTWLNEGLAQLFENAVFEHGTFRIDQAPQPIVERLQQRIRRSNEPLLPKLFEGDSGRFLLDNSLHQNQLDYDIAWGLVWYLVFHQRLLEHGRLVQYVPEKGDQKLSNMSFDQTLAQFESRWRSFILSL